MAIAVTLGVVGKNNEKGNIQNERAHYKHDIAVIDDEDSSFEYPSEIDEDEEDTLESKIEKWQRSRVSEVNR